MIEMVDNTAANGQVDQAQASNLWRDLYVPGYIRIQGRRALQPDDCPRLM